MQNEVLSFKVKNQTLIKAKWLNKTSVKLGKEKNGNICRTCINAGLFLLNLSTDGYKN